MAYHRRSPQDQGRIVLPDYVFPKAFHSAIRVTIMAWGRDAGLHLSHEQVNELVQRIVTAFDQSGD